MLEKIIRDSASYMLERFERDADYPFIDTKFNIATGLDFGPGDEDFRRRDFIYGWIQGRGLESLAEHVAYFRAEGEAGLAGRLTRMLETVTDAMETLRRANGGRIAFAMTPEGRPRFPGVGGYGNYSDLFYGKGLFAAASLLGRKDLAAEAEKLFRFVVSDIAADRFRSDQHGFDPKNPVGFVPGKFAQGPRMIALYGLARFGEAMPDGPYLDTAAEFIRHILRHHAVLTPTAELRKFDFVEAIGGDGNVWRDGEKVLCDPGHALEFVGLAGKCLLLMRRLGKHVALIEECKAVLPELFRHVFDLGFQPEACGIVKSFDLVSRRPVNTDMPWWSLPETIRAGAEMIALYPERTAGIGERVAAAQRAFLDGFIAAGTHGFACQTRDASGRPVEVIPAVPDADPGYHTNLSLIDFLRLRAAADAPSDRNGF